MMHVLSRLKNAFSILQNESELQKKFDLLSSVLDNTPALIAFWDNQQCCRFANKPYLDWFGQTPQNLYGKKLVELLGNELYEKNKPYITGALAGIEQHFERALLHHKYKETRYTQATYIPDVLNRKVRGFFVLVVDVTAQKNAELAALQTNQIRNNFVTNISHEIRTPLNGIIAMLQLVLETELTEEQREYLTIASRSTSNLFAIVNQILEFSKMGSVHFNLHKSQFPIRTMMMRACETIFVRAREKNLATSLEITETVPAMINGDELRLQQAILNLLDNALKCTDSGSIAVKVSTTPDSQSLIFEIIDTGIGIPEQKQQTIFEEFRQVDETPTRSIHGTGLGLTIVKMLVEKMGGSIGVKSQPGKGSTFYFIIPVEIKFSP